uniref:Putative secreted protein n=1 Tax=Ixodes ricinus TaxID=34613 RepID=A0A6B0U248_IXORI
MCIPDCTVHICCVLLASTSGGIPEPSGNIVLYSLYCCEQPMYVMSLIPPARCMCFYVLNHRQWMGAYRLRH